MRDTRDIQEFWGFALGFLFSLFGILGIAKLTEGPMRSLMLQSAFDGALAGLICLSIVVIVVLQY